MYFDSSRCYGLWILLNTCLQNGKGGGMASEVLPPQKGVQKNFELKVSAILIGGGHKKFPPFKRGRKFCILS